MPDVLLLMKVMAWVVMGETQEMEVMKYLVETLLRVEDLMV